jgi:Myb/SANT-like DNA-binding domain
MQIGPSTRRSTEGGQPTETQAEDAQADKKSSCIWTDADVDRLIQFLIDNKATVADGGKFKGSTWTAVAAHLNNFITKGAPKTADSCKSKWDRVSENLLPWITHADDCFLQLRGFYKTVDYIKNNTSGFTWDDKLGLNIGAHNEQEYKILERVSLQSPHPLVYNDLDIC